MCELSPDRYVRLNRDRMRGSEGEEAAKASLGTLYDVMLDSTILLAPIVPFITETIYQNLSRALPEKDARKAASVHFVMIPKPDQAAMRPDIERAVGRMQQVPDTIGSSGDTIYGIEGRLVTCYILVHTKAFYCT